MEGDAVGSARIVSCELTWEGVCRDTFHGGLAPCESQTEVALPGFGLLPSAMNLERTECPSAPNKTPDYPAPQERAQMKILCPSDINFTSVVTFA